MSVSNTTTSATPLSIEDLDANMRERVGGLMESIIEAAGAHRAEFVKSEGTISAARETIATEYVKMLAALQVFEDAFGTVSKRLKSNLFPEPAAELRFTAWRERYPALSREMNMLTAEVGSLVAWTGTELALRNLQTAMQEADKAKAELERLKARIAKAAETRKKAEEPAKDEPEQTETPKPRNGRKGNGTATAEPEVKPEVKPEVTAEEPKPAAPVADSLKGELTILRDMAKLPDEMIKNMGNDPEKMKVRIATIEALIASNDETPSADVSPVMGDKLAKDKSAPTTGGGGGRQRRR